MNSRPIIFLADGTPAMEIPLTQGKVAWVSPEDYERVAQYRWRSHQCGKHQYAARGQYPTMVLLHRFILDSTAPHIDHRDGAGLNNTRKNLRAATVSQNHANCIPWSRTGFKGIERVGKRWRAVICQNYKRHYLGVFDTPEQAAKTYDIKALELFGEFARLNFPPQTKAGSINTFEERT